MYLFMGEQSLENVPNNKYLGVNIGQDLNWLTHLKNLENKLAKAL